MDDLPLCALRRSGRDEKMTRKLLDPHTGYHGSCRHEPGSIILKTFMGGMMSSDSMY